MQFSHQSNNIKPSGYLIADIFNEAGQAFARMGTLTSSMKDDANFPGGNSKWSQADINKFYNAVKTFSTELNSICNSLDNKIKEEMHCNIERNILTESGCNSAEIITSGWKSIDSVKIDPKSEEHSPDYLDPEDDERDNYNSDDDDNYELE